MDERIGMHENKIGTLLLKYNAMIILIILVVIAAVTSDVFFTVTNLTNLARQQTPLMLASLGMLLIVLTGGIDLSVGAVTALGGMVTGLLITQYGLTSGASVILVLLIVLAVGFLIGAVSGFFVVVLKMAPFIATLATMTMTRGVCYLSSNGQPVRLPPGEAATDLLSGFGSKAFLAVPYPVWLVIGLVLICLYIMRNTVFGRLVIAVGSNEEAVKLAGININIYKFFVYAICGMLCTLGGFIVTTRAVVAAPSVCSGLELDAIAACVIGGASLNGGKGTVLNTVIGVLILSIITNVMNLLSIAAYPQQIIKGIVIVLAVTLQYFTSRNQTH